MPFAVLRFAVTIFLGAFLLFQVQPLVGKRIMPWFGGGSAVWTTCLVFFQAALLGGYLSAHLLSGRPMRVRAITHLAMLVVTLWFLPIGPDADTARAVIGDAPTVGILALLLGSIGLPYLLLASTGPVLQDWFATTHPGRSPYRLYALSNVGSLLALVTYPIAVEPLLGLRGQTLWWSLAYGVFALLSGWCAVRLLLAPRDDAGGRVGTRPPSRGPADAVRPARVLLWLTLAATGSAMLVATTNQLCLDVASFPFLWIVPLAVYLLTFVVSFDNDRWYDRRVFGVLLVASAATGWYALATGPSLALWKQVPAYGFVLFTCCMTCHGELVRRRPAPSRLTLFYLVIATGGAIGGLLVAIVAPRVFLGYWEFHVALAACCAIGLGCRYAELLRRGRILDPVCVMMVILQGVLVVALYRLAANDYRHAVASARNFYGVVRVVEDDRLDQGRRRVLYNGHIDHGGQFLDGEWARRPVSYYGADSAIGLTFDGHPARAAGRPLRIGVLGLGVGTVAVYGRAGDEMRFYEINPAVARFARSHFSYLADTAAKTEIVPGDGRVRLEAERAAGATPYDVLVIDAFTGDAVPVHLLTLECFRLYFDRLAPDGVLLVHVSNRFVDFVPVIRAVAAELGVAVTRVNSRASSRLATSATSWIAITRDAEVRRRILPGLVAADDWQPQGPRVLWTDDRSSLWPLLRLRSP